MRESEDSNELESIPMMVDWLSKRKGVIVDNWREFGNMDAIREDLMLFTVYAHSTIEELSARLIAQHIIDDRFQDGGYQYAFSQMSQAHRERLMSECELVDDGLLGKLSEFETLRNKVVHEPHPHLDWKKDDIKRKLDHVVEVLQRISDGLLATAHSVGRKGTPLEPWLPSENPG